MASFTFRAGNTRALLRLPLYALGALVALLVPRTPQLWVVGCGVGLGEGALPMYRLAREQLGPGVRVVWLATTATELDRARSLGFDAVAKTSATGLWLTLRAQVLVVTHGAGDVNRYGTRGGFLVQLWHGIPLKKLHLDSPVARSARVGGALVAAVLTRGYRIAGRRISLFPVASRRIVGRIGSAFAVPPDRIVATGDPRDDVLLSGTSDERRRAARGLLEAAVGELPPRVVLYAPTWRDGAPDPAAPDPSTWLAIGEWLAGADAALIVRIHPLGKGDYDAGPQLSHRVRILDSRTLVDVNPVLAAVDALVTDYSSIAFDYALVDGPTVFLATDVDDYVQARGLYEPYAVFSGGRHVTTWPAALARLTAVLAGDAATAAHTRWLRAEHFDHLEGGATARVLTEIRRRVAGSAGDGAGTVAPARPRIENVSVADDRLVLTFAAAAPHALWLAGSRESIPAPADGRVARVPLVRSRWGTDGLALPSGDYRLVLGVDGPSTRVDLPAALPAVTQPRYRAEVLDADGGLVLRMSAPEPVVGAKAYRRAHPRPENAVVFESFYGRMAGDNPLGVDRALARLHPDVTRYWSVLDHSIGVPDGAVALVEGTAEWWRARAAARLLVVNDWLRWPYRRRTHQHVLQTWHGTMLKRLANDRPDTNLRKRLAVYREQLRWDALLTQNPYSEQIFRRAYAMHGPVWHTGYPRNDVLFDAARADLVRRRLDLPAGVRTVLYAPTWRDDRHDLVGHLDLPAFVDALPADHVVLVRGHTRTLAAARELAGERIVDVSTYPHIADLMLVADVLVTDYSSVMFDFAVTGKPIVFFVPDLEDYGGRLRGFYFDLAGQAPGPVVEAAADLPDAVRDPGEHAARYAAWRTRFVPYDDGAAGERVVRRLYSAGWLG